mmetsp:Transcript_42834/g.68843  ORF Transcript_42834/g.68843 Transcript_42834/m.68843 type:complete len:88 (+) Transcript_42834:432-695(+)
MDECAEELKLLMDEGKLQGVPLLVFANKQDLVSAQDVSSIEGRLHISEDRAFHIQGCSAKTGDGLSNGLEWLVQEMNETDDAGNGGK